MTQGAFRRELKESSILWLSSREIIKWRFENLLGVIARELQGYSWGLEYVLRGLKWKYPAVNARNRSSDVISAHLHVRRLRPNNMATGPGANQGARMQHTVIHENTGNLACTQ